MLHVLFLGQAVSTALGRMGHAEGGRVRKLRVEWGWGRGKGGGGRAHDGSCPDGVSIGTAYSLQLPMDTV